MFIKMSDLFDVSLDELIKSDKNFKETTIETYQQPVSNQNHHPMDGWEFLSNYWWLFFPVVVTIWWMLQTFN